ncbi:RND transporter, partial [Cribrihabitans sp. XS_ASV171]
RLSPGDRAIVERWGGPMPLKARIAKIEPRAYTKVSALGIEEQRVDVVFDLLSPPSARPALGHGFSVFLRVVEWETESALQVPLSALFRHGAEWAVFVNDSGTARLQVVGIGRSNSLSVEVLTGLTEGEEVLLHPGERSEDGNSIRVGGKN